jgi:SAM-dependent methyltransferase
VSAARVEREAALARYYDLEHDALVADAALYCELARRAGDPVLELGCGTGRLLEALAQAGRRVVGVDRSAVVLARAEARLRARGVPIGHWRLVAADVRALQLGERFALILLPLDLLGYFHTLADQLAVLGVVRQHLHADGRAVIDLTFPPSALVGQPEGVAVHQWTRGEPDGTTVTKWWVRELSPDVQLQRLTAFYDVASPDGALRRWVDELTLRYYYRYELELLLARAGLAIDGLYGSYALDELRADSPRLLAVARVVA